jgi:acyl-CoA oxidase
METHLPFAGIDVGDVGAKIALIFSDNGYLGFNNYRQPKDSLLSKYVSVSSEGKFESLGKDSTKLAYGGMLNLRILILFSSSYYLGK